MSFSFSKLFSQDEPSDDSPPDKGTTPDPSKESPAPNVNNPFGALGGSEEEPLPEASAPLPEGAGQAASPESITAGRPFFPDPQSTSRGTFEALFSGEESGVGSPDSSTAGVRTGEYSIREILPFLPPALVSTSDLPMDRSFSLPLPAVGTEVKLSAIQAACPEVFGTPITPLNDSEVTLPPSESEGPDQTAPLREATVSQPDFPDRSSAGPSPHAAQVAETVGASAAVGPAPSAGAGPFGQAPGFSPPRAVEADPFAPSGTTETAPVNRASDTDPAVPGGNPFSASDSTPAASPVSASEDASPGFPGGGDSSPGFINPFAAPVDAFEAPPSSEPEGTETLEEPAPEVLEPADENESSKSQLHHSPTPALGPETVPESADEEAPANPSPFGFPEPKKEESVFGAFGAAPQPVPRMKKPAAPPKTPGENAFAGFPGEMPDFAKLAEESSLASDSPKMVSLDQAAAEIPTNSPIEGESSSPLGKTFPEEASPGLEPESQSFSKAFVEETPAVETEESQPKSEKNGTSWLGNLFGSKSSKESESESPSAEEDEATAPSEAVAGPDEASKSQGSFGLFGGESPITDEPSPFGSDRGAESEVATGTAQAPGAEKLDPASPFGGTAPFPWSQEGGSSVTGETASPFGMPGDGEPSEKSPFGFPGTPDSVSGTEVERALGEIPSTDSPVEPPGAEGDSSENSTPALTNQESSSESGDRNLVFSIRDLLGPLSAVTGIDFSVVPASSKVRFPLELVESQLATGEVSLTVADLCCYCDAETAILLRSIDGLLPVPIPENELYHQIQDLDPDLVPESDETLETEFSTLFASEAVNDSGLSWLSPSGEAVAESKPEVPGQETALPMPEEQIVGEQGSDAASEPVEEIASPTKAEAGPEPPTGRESAPEETETKSIPSVAVSAKSGKCVISVQRHTSPPAEERPKDRADSPGQSADKGLQIPGPLPPRPTPDSDSPASASEATDGSQTEKSDATDPVAPPPRARLANEEPAPEGIVESGGAFDDLASLAVDEEAKEAGEGDAIETLDEVASVESFEVRAEPGGEEAVADFSFSNFASLDELEPFDPSSSLEWSVEKEPPSSPAASEPRKAKPRREFGSMTSPTAKKTEAEAPAEAAGFFEELESVSPERMAPEPGGGSAAEPAALPSASPSAIRDIELRAVFGTNEPFSYRRVADLSADLPGVEACAVVGPGLAAQSPRGREAGDLAGRAHALLNSARELARATGVPNAETFTLHTEQGVISVFSHGECCLTVRHAEGQFDPGVREKLILVVRGVTALDH